MSASTLPNATLTAAYEAMTPGSAKLAAKAGTCCRAGSRMTGATWIRIRCMWSGRSAR